MSWLGDSDYRCDGIKQALYSGSAPVPGQIIAPVLGQMVAPVPRQMVATVPACALFRGKASVFPLLLVLSDRYHPCQFRWSTARSPPLQKPMRKGHEPCSPSGTLAKKGPLGPHGKLWASCPQSYPQTRFYIGHPGWPHILFLTHCIILFPGESVET